MNIRMVIACFLIVPVLSVRAMLPRDEQIFGKKETHWFNDSLPQVALCEIFVSGENLYDPICHGAELMKEKAKDNEPVAKLIRFYRENGGSKVDKDDQAKVDIFGLPLKSIESWKEGRVEFKGFVFACYQLGVKGETMIFQEKLASLKKAKGL